MIVLYIVFALVAVALLWVVVAYNGFVRLRNRTQEAWSDIDVQLKRRYDLIPNIISTVKGYATHERATLEKVTAARTAAMQVHDNKNATREQIAASENMLSSTLKSIFALSESYPDLKANQNFLQLQDELSDTENKIQASRRFYNGMVRDLNTKIESFPSNIIAGVFNFKQQDFFKTENETERANVQVSF